MKQYFGLSIGTGYWIIETLIIFSIGIVFTDLNLIIWGYLNLFITTQIVDITAEGIPYTKGAYIMSKNEDSIKERIISELDRGITHFSSVKADTAEKSKMFCLLLLTGDKLRV